MEKVLAVVLLASALACAPVQKKNRAPLPTGTRINVNTADAAMLASLPGIGGKEAKQIVAHRQKHGPFATIDDLAKVKKIGRKDVEKLRPYAVTR